MRSSIALCEEDHKVLKKIAAQTGLNNFWVCGSVTYQRVAKELGIIFPLDDWDLAIEGGMDDYGHCMSIIKSAGFTIIKDRPYYLKFKKAHQIIATKNIYSIDIAFVEHFLDLGHFNWESIFWHYPSGLLFDPHKGLDGIKRKNLVPIVSPDDENPFFLVARLAKLCARFNLALNCNDELKEFSSKLSRRIQGWSPGDEFHGQYARGHGYAGLFEAIIRAPDKQKFMVDINESGLLRAMCPEIDCSSLFSSGIFDKIIQVKTIKQMLETLEDHLQSSPERMGAFKARLEPIYERLRIKETK